MAGDNCKTAPLTPIQFAAADIYLFPCNPIVGSEMVINQSKIADISDVYGRKQCRYIGCHAVSRVNSIL